MFDAFDANVGDAIARELVTRLSPLEQQDLINRLLLHGLNAEGRELLISNGKYSDDSDLLVVAACGEEARWLRAAMQHLTRDQKLVVEQKLECGDQPSLPQRVVNSFFRR